jgi:thioesterase domain-containing protein
VPAAYVQLQSLPLTANGKVDRRALPVPDTDAYAVREYEAPEGETETRLSGIWADVLKVERVGRQDNFFDLGGNSLLAMSVTNLIGRMGVNMSPLDVFSFPTIQSFAEKISANQKRPLDDTAVCIRKGASEYPLFFPHEGSGDLLHIQALAQYIDSSVPIYGLPEKYVDGGDATAKTIEGMATRMVGMIRAVQPHGPYRVAGWSLGGTLAYEIAVQLIGADQDVEFVGLFDTFYRPDEIEAIERDSYLHDDKQYLLSFMRRSVGNEPLNVDGEKGKLLKAIADIEAQMVALSFEDAIRKCREVLAFPKPLSDATPAQIQRRFARNRLYTLAVRRYYAQPIPKQIHLFVAQEGPPDPLRGWEAVLPQSRIRLMPVPGTHLSMMQHRNIQVLGRTLSSTITARTDCQEIAERRYSPLIILQHGTDHGAPLFCVPGAGASVTSLNEVVSCLEKTTRVFGFQPRGLDGADALLAHSTVTAAAEAYMRAIPAEYQKGPLHLLGHSFGGWVVLEMAHRLIRASCQIASVTVLDSEPPDTGMRDYWSSEVTMAWIEAAEQNLNQSLGIKLRDLEQRDEAGQRKLLHQQLVKKGGMPRRSHPDLLRGPLRAFGMSLRAQFKPDASYGELFSGEFHLVSAADLAPEQVRSNQSTEDTIQRWKQWIPKLIYHQVPGNHMTMLKKPHASVLAFLIQDCLTGNGRLARQNLALVTSSEKADSAQAGGRSQR